MTTTLARQLQLRGSDADWAANTGVIPLYGEVCFETNGIFARCKIGDGVRAYGDLPYIGWDNTFTFSTQSQVAAGLVDNLPVAPNTLSAVYPKKLDASPPEIIENGWTFNGGVEIGEYATIVNSPRSGGSGSRDAVARADMDIRFASISSSGASDSGKAPILNSQGKLDRTFIPSETLPTYRGLFDPVTGSPPLINQTGGGVVPVANGGDYFVASDTGVYDFAVGAPGGSTSVSEGATVLWDSSAETWSVVNPGGTAFDPGAIRQTPTSEAENTIVPTTDLINLSLKALPGQTSDLFRVRADDDTDFFRVLPDGRSAVQSIFFYPQSIAPADPLSSYKSGLSISELASQGTWPIFGQIETYKVSNTAGSQAIYNGTRSLSRTFSGSNWSAWREFAMLDNPAFTGTPTTPTPSATNNSTAIQNTAGNIARDASFGGGTFLYIDASLSLAMLNATNYALFPQTVAGDIVVDGTAGGFDGSGVTFPTVGTYLIRILGFGTASGFSNASNSGMIEQSMLVDSYDAGGAVPAPDAISYVRTTSIESGQTTAVSFDVDVIFSISSPSPVSFGLVAAPFYKNVSSIGTFTLTRLIIIGYQIGRGASQVSW